jgi:hypothetical protein
MKAIRRGVESRRKVEGWGEVADGETEGEDGEGGLSGL